MENSLLRSEPRDYKRGWNLARFRRVFLGNDLPIPVYKKRLTNSLIRKEIDRLFDTEVLKEELLEEIAMCIERARRPSLKRGIFTTDGKYAIVLTDYHESKKLVQLLGIIREYAFRNIGGGTGGIDLDELDFNSSMSQLIAIDLQAVKEKNYIGIIFGSYRYKICRSREDYLNGSTAHFLEFDEQFTNQVRGEMGRSLKNPYYKDLPFKPVLWGLAYIKVINPDMIGYFGKITLYKQYELVGADKYILRIANEYWNGKEVGNAWVKPELRIPEEVAIEGEEERHYFKYSILRGLLMSLLKKFYLTVPPIVAVYDYIVGLANLCYFGSFRHTEFGDVIEMGVSVNFRYLTKAIYRDFLDPIEATVKEDAKR